jgi:hypothetical protein
MMRRLVVLLMALLGLPAAAVAQSSIFGIRGPGFAGRPLSTRAIGTGGSFGLFDGESQLSPGALSAMQHAFGAFTILGDYRSVTTPVGDAKTQEFRFPMVTIAAPLNRGRFSIGLGASTYANRDFTLATLDTVELRDSLVAVADTLRSRGGLSDLQLSFAWRPQQRTTIGASVHVITGTDRLVAKRVFGDTNYVTVVQGNELSTTAFGVGVGAVHEFSSRLAIAALIRKDFTAKVNIDSAQFGGSTGTSARYGLPWTIAAGLKVRRSKLELALQGAYRTWSAADSALVDLGAPGSANSIDLSVGAELSPNVRRPTQFPLRIGARYATLPLRVDDTIQPTEFAVSIGSGARFADGRAGIDLSLERVWRDGGANRSETAWLLYTGISVRP